MDMEPREKEGTRFYSGGEGGGRKVFGPECFGPATSSNCQRMELLKKIGMVDAT
jgi:hypothetical protein